MIFRFFLLFSLSGHTVNNPARDRLNEIVREKFKINYKQGGETKNLIDALVKYIDQFGITSENELPRLSSNAQSKMFAIFARANLTKKTLGIYDQTGTIKTIFQHYLKMNK